jgi:D-glycero-D-manno-heptose 1,7-bisphosphate phosphatase
LTTGNSSSSSSSRERTVAVFLDRDGVISDLVYNPDEGTIGSPLSASQLKVHPYAGETVSKIRELGFKAIVISNQPGVAKKQFSYSEFERMNQKIRREISKSNASFDAEYYCMHHPHAALRRYRSNCACRKPKPGLILQAANEHGINLKKSYFVGDALVDVKAGKAAGCKTVLIGHMTDLLNRMIEKEHAEPDYLISNLKEVVDIIA